MTTTATLLDEAILLHQAGSLAGAAAIYRQILAGDPDHHESLHLLGLAASQSGEAEAAVAMIGRAVALAPEAAHYRTNLGNGLRAAGRLDEATAALQQALALRPASAAIASNLGSVLIELARWPDALQALRRAVALDPALADARYNLGNALARSDDPAAAAEAYRECLELRPDFADAQFNLGHAMVALGRPDAAAECYRQALLLDPSHVARNNLGVLLQAADRLEEAEACFAEAWRQRPADPGIGGNLAACRLAQGRTEEAEAGFAEVLAMAPDDGAARLGRLMARLPVVARDAAGLAAGRAAYATDLAQLVEEAEQPALRQSLATAAGASQPFFLAYQGGDDRSLQQAYGELMCALAEPAATMPAAPRPGEKLRIGIVSGFFCEHTVWTLFLRGWLERLDRSRIRLFGFHTGARQDAVTAIAATRCERFVAGARTPQAWRDAVLAEAPHVLLYPEIGMDPVSGRLAAQRLAPVQCAAWGHPVTSGLPSIDYFLGSALMEPPGAAAHYAERLVLLPNLGICHTPEPAPKHSTALDRAGFGMRADAVVYWSGQNLPKYHPDHDEVFPRIARAVPGCQFVFIGFGRGHHMTDLFRDRLDRAFAAFGLRAAAHCLILPQLSQARFMAGVALSDVVLDTIGWSGGKSTLDMLATDPAIVTLAGRFMRGRHTAAILAMLQATETVTTGVDEYVAMAIRLGLDRDFRELARSRVRRGRPSVQADETPVRALEAFLIQAVRRGPELGRAA